MDYDNEDRQILSPELQQVLDEALAAADMVAYPETPGTDDRDINERHVHELVAMVNAAGHSQFVEAYNAADDEISVGEARGLASHHAGAVVALSMLKFGLDFPSAALAVIATAGPEMAEQGQTVAVDIYNHITGRCDCDG